MLTHAYGLASRGNSDGGLKHIEDFIDRSTHFVDKIEQYRWFFQCMLDWEDTGPGLLLGQRFLHRLVVRDARADALKVLSRCYHENPAFRPLPEDRDPLLVMAQAAKRQDLVGLLDVKLYE
ncbi:MAG: hypothetical protein R3315_13510 [Woeseiaceae bacterium]|nr:hypothetical protein [Woeseiaceae bacterium]